MQYTRNGTDIWLARWTSSTEAAGSSVSDETASRKLYFIVFAGFNILFTAVRSISFAYASISGARGVHKELVSSVLYAPMSLLGSSSTGSLISRFSFDMEKVDSALPFISNMFLANVFGCVGTCATLFTLQPFVLIFVAIIIAPPFRIPGMMAWNAQYRTTARSVS